MDAELWGLMCKFHEEHLEDQQPGADMLCKEWEQWWGSGGARLLISSLLHHEMMYLNKMQRKIRKSRMISDLMM